MNNYSAAKKQYNGVSSPWWLRSSASASDFHFWRVQAGGYCNTPMATFAFGVSPAFRIA